MLGLPILIFIMGALAAIVSRPRAAVIVGCSAACMGSIAMIPTHLAFSTSWTTDIGFAPIELFFMLPIAILGIAAAIHSLGYLKGHGNERAGLYWFFFNLMLASMFCVTLLNDPIPFLLVWEMMGITSAALVAFDHKSGESMRAVWIYLAACQAGAAFLILMFIELGAAETSALTVFILATLGFGLKAGFTGLHVWLPEAHPAAPAPVSAIMSGAMINLGIFGILKFCLEAPIGQVPFSVVGWTFLVLGILGALLGIMFAMPQKNLKRLLAFSSIENMGIISMGIGLSALGVHYDMIIVVVLGYAGAALHIINHALLKGGLFLCAGSVFKATGTLNMDDMGGLMKRMPVTGTLFTLNAASISGLPPMNGFLSEFLLYAAAFQGIIHGSGAFLVACLCTVITLALVGGLAVAAFSKTIGAAFLGEPRSKQAASAVEATRTMTGPVIILFAMSMMISFAGPFALQYFLAGIRVKFPSDIFTNLFIAFTVLVFMTAALLYLRFRLLPCGGDNIPGPTWDCGFAKPTPRMAYTGTAFTQPLVDFLAPVLRPLRRLCKPSELFPLSASAEVSVDDAGIRYLWSPLFSTVAKAAEKLHSTQSGHLHAYVLVMVAAVAAMFIWAMATHPNTTELPPARIGVRPSPSEILE